MFTTKLLLDVDGSSPGVIDTWNVVSIPGNCVAVDEQTINRRSSGKINLDGIHLVSGDGAYSQRACCSL